MIAGLSLTALIVLFLGLAAAVAIVGTGLTRVADRLATATGWGEAIMGAILLGGVTSLPGITTSVTAAWEGQPDLAFSNAVGGIAAQTVFIAVADIFYRRANLEHASASLTSLMQGVFLVGLLGMVILAMSAPAVTIYWVHPVSLLLLLAYPVGSRFIIQAQDHPMWKPVETTETVAETDSTDKIRDSLMTLWLRFALYGALVAVAGYFIAQTGLALADRTGMSQSFVGTVGTSVATSLPELVVAITAVRRGALTLAVSNIIGGNAFDLLFLSFADLALTSGSLYHGGDGSRLFVLALTITLTCVFLLGLLFRQREGPGRIGWESMLMILLYLGGQAMLFYL